MYVDKQNDFELHIHNESQCNTNDSQKDDGTRNTNKKFLTKHEALYLLGFSEDEFEIIDN